MTVETDDDRAQFATNATTGPWTVPYYFLADSELAVTYTNATGVDTLLVLNVDYTVAGAGVAGGGTITTTQAYAAGGQLVIVRNVEFVQPIEYLEGDGFPAKTHERGLDRLTMIAQQLREIVARTIHFPASYGGSTEVGDVATRGGKLLSFDIVTGALAYVTGASGSALDLATQLQGSNGAGLSGFNPTVSYVTATIGQRLEEQISPSSFPWLAKADGTDAGAAINACLAWAATKKLRVEMPSGKFSTTIPIVHPPGVHVQAAGSGGYTALTGAAAGATIIEYSGAGDTWTVDVAGIVRDLQVRPTNYAAVGYSLANYPAGTGNAARGIVLKQSAWAIGCTAIGFSTAAFHNPAGQAVAKFHHCHAFNSATGYLISGTDGTVTDSVAMFCHTAGIDGSAGAFWKYLGNRIEWNARTGIVAGAESVGHGNIFDRNGWEGLSLASGAWGQTWTGNYFSRNGCGGDASQGFGRWSFSIPSDPSFVATTLDRSAQVRIEFQRGLVLCNNRFRHGQSDSNDGCDGPANVYCFAGAVGATAIDDVRIRSNAGDQQDSVTGWNPAAYTNTGARATGTDTPMVAAFVNGFEVGPQVLQTNILKNRVPVAATATTIAVQVPKMSSSWVYIWARTGAAFGSIRAVAGGNGSGGGLLVSAPATDLGTITATAVIAAGAAGSAYDTVTFTFSTSCFATPTVVAA